MDLFKGTYFANHVQTWVLFLVVTILAVLAIVILRTLAVSRLALLARKTDTELDDFFVELIGKTKLLFILVVAIYISSFLLKLPIQIEKALNISFTLAIILQGAFWAHSSITFLVQRTRQKRVSNDAGQLPGFTLLGFISKLTIWTFVLLVVLNYFGVNITALVAGLGVSGIAVALAVQNLLGDVIGSLSIVLDKPIEIGDFICIDDFKGNVEKIGMKTTRIRSVNGEEIILSNSDVLRSRIRNYKRLNFRRGLITIGVSYDTPPQKLETIPGIIKSIIQVIPSASLDRAHLKNAGSVALEYEISFLVSSSDHIVYMDIQQTILIEIIKAFRRGKIKFAYPVRVIRQF
jgi:small-conductance mechanosensitive channel